MKSQNERVGTGAMWEKEGRNGVFMSGKMDFVYNLHPITAKFIAFKNTRKEKGSKQPDWNIFVDDAFPSVPRPNEPPPIPKPNTEDDIP
jgi:hypothetical protein